MANVNMQALINIGYLPLRLKKIILVLLVFHVKLDTYASFCNAVLKYILLILNRDQNTEANH